MIKKNKDSFWMALGTVLVILCFLIGLSWVFVRVLDAVSYVASVPERIENLEKRAAWLEYYVKKQEDEIQALKMRNAKLYPATSTLKDWLQEAAIPSDWIQITTPPPIET